MQLGEALMDIERFPRRFSALPKGPFHEPLIKPSTYEGIERPELFYVPPDFSDKRDDPIIFPLLVFPLIFTWLFELAEYAR